MGRLRSPQRDLDALGPKRPPRYFGGGGATLRTLVPGGVDSNTVRALVGSGESKSRPVRGMFCPAAVTDVVPSGTKPHTVMLPARSRWVAMLRFVSD